VIQLGDFGECSVGGGLGARFIGSIKRDGEKRPHVRLLELETMQSHLTGAAPR
jgi:hypothetical protein